MQKTKNVYKAGIGWRPEFYFEKTRFRGIRYPTEYEAYKALCLMQDLAHEAKENFPKDNSKWPEFVKRRFSEITLAEDDEKEIFNEYFSNQASSGSMANGFTQSGTSTNCSARSRWNNTNVERQAQMQTNDSISSVVSSPSITSNGAGSSPSNWVVNQNFAHKETNIYHSPERTTQKRTLKRRILELLTPSGDKDVDSVIVRLYQDFDKLDEPTVILVDKLLKKHGHEVPVILHMLKTALKARLGNI